MTLESTGTTIHTIPQPRSGSWAEELRDACGGAVHLPGGPGYDAARQPWAVAVDQRPAAVVYPADADEVAAVVRIAARYGLRVAPQGTGHNAAPLGDLSGVVLLRTSGMTEVRIDVPDRTARVGAGALWLDVVEAAAPHGLMALHGSSPDVGVVGYSLGGGIGWFARSHGLQSNSITAVELVTASGELLRATADSHAELFWALRGGGGNLGIVTALEFALYPLGTAYAGWLVWDWHDAERVLAAWAEWAVGAPDAVTTAFRIMQLPPIEEIPEPLRGRQIAVVSGAVSGSDEVAEQILAPLRALQPEMDTFARTPVPALVRLHGDPEGPTPAVSDTLMLHSLPEEAISAFVAAAGAGSGSSLVAAELRQLGGALGRPHPGAGALPALDGPFVAFAIAIAMDAESAAKGQQDASGLMRALAPWANGAAYLNFVERATDTSTGYSAEAYARLQAIRAAADPHGMFKANHEVR